MTFHILRGTNISHWLSQSKNRGDLRRVFFTQDDVKRIADWGLDHIRLPVDEEQMWTHDMHRQNEAFDLLNAALDWCDSAGLKVIIDLHILRSHHFLNDDPPLFTDVHEAQKFGWMWSDLSDALSCRNESKVAYELMNEPVARNDSDWNRVLRYPLAAIREREPSRVVIIGSNKWCQCQTFQALEVPNDPNLILSFHFYNPMLVTHYRASWVPKVAQYEGPVHYPGKPISDSDWEKLNPTIRRDLQHDNRLYDRSQMEKDISLAVVVAKKHDLPLHCGEFGAVKYAPDAIRVAWYQDLLDVFSSFNIAWTNWDYKGGFGLIDSHNRETAVVQGLKLHKA